MSSGPTLSPAQLSSLHQILPPQRVQTGFPDRLAYQNDCWPKGIILSRGRKLDHHLASAILQPESTAEIQAIIDFARTHRLILIPYGAGSGVCGGAVPDRGSLVVDLKRMNHLLDVDPANSTVRAQPGIIGMDLETRLNHAGWTMGHYPSSLYCSSLGGYLAARSAGQYSSRYGKIEDMVLSMQVVTGTGELLRTSADTDHPTDHPTDLTPLFVGSEGTLGFITEARMKIEPLPEARIYRGFEFTHLEDALTAMRAIMQAGIRPAVARLYDEFDSLIASARKASTQPSSSTSRSSPPPPSPPLFARLKKQAGRVLSEQPFPATVLHKATRALLGRAVGNPLIVNRLSEVLPTACLLVLGFEGDPDLVETDSAYAFDLCRLTGRDLGPGPGEHWRQNRFNVSYKQSPMFHLGAFVDTMEVSTSWENLLPLYQAVRRALRTHVFVMAHFSHIYPEGSSIYFTFAGFGKDLDDTLQTYQDTWTTGLNAVANAGASIAHHHGVGQSKAPWTRHDHHGGADLFAMLKDTYDPDRILNPGKVYR